VDNPKLRRRNDRLNPWDFNPTNPVTHSSMNTPMTQSPQSPQSQPSRAQWDLCRFLRTLTYFGAVPILNRFGWFQDWMGSRVPSTQPTPASDPMVSSADSTDSTLFDFTQPDTPIAEVWGELDDVVMGGVSESQFGRMGASAVFSGTVSTANSGGFASVRTRNFDPPLNLSGFTGAKLRVRGDGQRYKFMLRQDTTWDSVAYCASFDTVDREWTTVQIPFATLVPVFRARTRSDMPALDLSRVCAMQLMLSKFEYDGALNPTFHPGAFQLQIERIQLYRDPA
jgi:hypothetical protein